MRVVIRADASSVIGSGHIMRSLTLAQALRNTGADVSFITRQHAGNLNDLLQAQRFDVACLPARVGEVTLPGAPDHAAWIGASWQDDARGSSAAIEVLGGQPDWLIVDHYGLDDRWEAALRRSVKRIFVIDDLADRRHDCDLLLDQNLLENMQQRYAGKVPAQCNSMLGPRYALLQPQYADLHEHVAPREGPVRRILIFFGGADRNNTTGLALRAFLSLNRADIDVDIVVGGNDANAGELRALAAGHTNVHIHTSVASMAPLISEADIAIGASGATSWERLCLGLPALVVTLAENQRPIAEALRDRGMVSWLGHENEVGLVRLQEALAAQLERGTDTAMSRRCRAVVDGRGVRRVCAALLLDGTTPLFARRANAADEELLLEWANNPATRRNSFSGATITAEEHHNWFAARLGDAANCLMFIIETEYDVALATVRFEKKTGCWNIHYSVAEPYRGRGLGRRVLELALTQLLETGEKLPVVGRVTAENLASHRIFRSLNFAAVADAAGVEYRRTL